MKRDLGQASRWTQSTKKLALYYCWSHTLNFKKLAHTCRHFPVGIYLLKFNNRNTRTLSLLNFKKKGKKCDDSINCQLYCSHYAQPQLFKGTNTSGDNKINYQSNTKHSAKFTQLYCPHPPLPILHEKIIIKIKVFRLPGSVFTSEVWSELGPVPVLLVEPNLLVQSNLSLLEFVQLQGISKSQFCDKICPK